MPRRLVAALVAALVSQSLLLLLLLASSPLPILSISPPPPHLPLPLPLLLSSPIPFLPRKRKRKRSSPLPSSPDPFPLSFCMSSSTFSWLSGLLDPLLDSPSPAALPSSARLALALSRLAAGASYSDLARRFQIPESAARACARRLCRVLCTNFRFWLAFPAASDLVHVSSSFESLPRQRGLPGCCGAVACPRFAGFATQIVSDSSFRILSIAAGFRADKPDFAVLRGSSLYKDVEGGRLLNSSQYLVGGGSYPLLPWLMVPYGNPIRGTCEEDFNAVVCVMRRPVLRAVASLRNWGVLGRLEEEEDARAAVACIATCAILHNVLLMREDYNVLADEGEVGLEVLGQGAEDGGVEGFVAEKRALALRSMLSVRARIVCD